MRVFDTEFKSKLFARDCWSAANVSYRRWYVEAQMFSDVGGHDDRFVYSTDAFRSRRRNRSNPPSPDRRRPYDARAHRTVPTAIRSKNENRKFQESPRSRVVLNDTTRRKIQTSSNARLKSIIGKPGDAGGIRAV